MVTLNELNNNNNFNIEAIIKEIDNAIKRTHSWYPWESGIIEDEIPIEVRNEIAKRYINEGGWKYVYHQTSSENGEKAGLTEFKLSMKPIKTEPKNTTVVTSNKIYKI